MQLESHRGRRRRLTETVARRRRSDYIRLMLSGDSSGHRWAETSPNFWAKTSIGSCSCCKRHHGAPRRDKGMCDIGARDRIYRLRASNRELERLVLRGEDPHGDAVALLSSTRLVDDLW